MQVERKHTIDSGTLVGSPGLQERYRTSSQEKKAMMTFENIAEPFSPFASDKFFLVFFYFFLLSYVLFAHQRTHCHCQQWSLFIQTHTPHTCTNSRQKQKKREEKKKVSSFFNGKFNAFTFCHMAIEWCSHTYNTRSLGSLDILS